MSIFTRKRVLKNKRILIGSKKDDIIPLPNLIDVQLESYEWFLQRERKLKGDKSLYQGLESLFQDVFPIVSPDEKMSLEYVDYNLVEEDIKADEYTSKEKGLTYSIPLKAIINLKIQETGEIRQKEIYFGEIPLM